MHSNRTLLLEALLAGVLITEISYRKSNNDYLPLNFNDDMCNLIYSCKFASRLMRMNNYFVHLYHCQFM